MSDIITYLNTDEDDDRTVFQSEDERKKLENDMFGITDDDTTEIEITQSLTQPERPYWQQAFG